MNTLLMAISNETIGLIIDIVIILILVGYAVVGISKGFYESLLKFIGSFGALAGAIFGSKFVLGLINGIVNITNIFANMVYNTLSSQSEVFTQVITDESARQQIIETLKGSEIFSILKNFMIELVEKAELNSVVGHVISAPIGYIISVIVVAILIFLLIKFIVFLLSKLFSNKEIEHGGKSGLDRTLGLFLGTAKGLVFIVALYFIISLLTYVPFISNTVSTYINETHVVKPTYTFVNEQITTFIETQDWNDIINKAFGTNK